MRAISRNHLVPDLLIGLFFMVFLFIPFMPGWATAPAVSETPLAVSPWKDDNPIRMFRSSGLLPPGKIEKSEKGERVIYWEWHPPQHGEEPPGAWFEKINHMSTDSTMTFLAYSAYRAKAWYVVFHGQEWGPYTQDVSDFTFSQDGKHLAYLVRSAEDITPFLDGQPGIKARVVDKFLFSQDSKHFSYRINDDRKTWHYVIDDKVEPAYPSVYGLTFSPDGQHYAYIAQNDTGKFCVVRDGKAMAFYDDIADGQERTWSRSFTTESPLLFSPDSTSLAYTATNQKKSFVMLDGIALREFTHPVVKSVIGFQYWISDIVFSANSQSLAYRATDERHDTSVSADGHTLVDRVIAGTYDLIVTPDATWTTPQGYRKASLVLSPDGKHIALVAGDVDKQSVFVDGKPGRYYQQISPIQDVNNHSNGYIRFSNNETFHYFARKDKKAWEPLVIEEHLPRVEE